MLRQIDAEYDVPATEEPSDSEPEPDDGSSIKLVPTAPVVLFGRDAPPLSKVLLQSQPEKSKSTYKAPVKRKTAPAAAAPRAKARKTTTRRDRRVASPIFSDSETLSDNQDNAENVSGGEEQEQPRNLIPEIPVATPEHDRPEEPVLETFETANTLAGLQHSEVPIAVPASIPPQAKSFDLSQLLSFDPASIGSTVLETEREKPRPTAIAGQLQHIRELLSAPIGTLVQDSAAVKLALEEIRPQLPEALRIKLWPAGHLPFFREKVESAKQRIEARRLQTPLRSEITQRCQALNEKKSALDAKVDSSTDDQELETLEKELADLEAKIRATRQLIQDKKDSIARSKQEAEDLKAQLQTELEQLRDLSRQVVVGEDKDDEAAIAEADQVRADAVRAIDEYLM